MAKTKKRQKPRPWTDKEEQVLLSNVEKHILCLTKAFAITSKEVNRTPSACAGHWYSRVSIKSGRTLFMTVSGQHVAVNRKNGKGQPLQLPIYKRILSILGFNY